MDAPAWGTAETCLPGCGDRQAGSTSARLIEARPRKSPYFFIHLQEN
ncbi:hypothetical protein HMPREF9720_2784 [Alistipes sp. HGB5]|nr:hypothetical protein HMPREF9720_2784 [Alistipes sp. HGB5]